jgi:hypothetical protein
MNLDELLTPNHGAPYWATPGTYYRQPEADGSGEGKLCSCLECQAAHRRAMRTPESPFHQGMIVQTPSGLGVVHQTNQWWTGVQLADTRMLYVVRFNTIDCTSVELGDEP